MIYRLALLLLVALLQACFYVELTGNVAGALVSVRPLRGGPNIVNDLPTATVEQVRAEQGAQTWDGFDDKLKLLLVGRVDLPTDKFVDDNLYLVTARGGLDMDWNGDGLLDEVGTPVEGVIHSIMTGEQLKQSNRRMNLLTDAIYRLLEPELARLSDREVLARMDELAAEAVVDVDGNGVRDYRDLLQWSQLRGDFPYPGLDEFLVRQEIAIGWGLDEQVTLFNAESLAMRADWRPARRGSRYADQLVACSVPVLTQDLCPFRHLPLIGQDTDRPGVDDIMSRVVVTHDWMTRRFREVLERFPEDLLLLFRSVSVIVIGDDIRPSYYQPASAAVFLDGGSLWVTQRERNTVSEEEDYRVEYASQVNFAHQWRLVKDNAHAMGELDANGNSTIEDVTLWMASLLFHELAHANDYLPSKLIEELSPLASPHSVAARLRSDVLANELPLKAPELFGVAAVLFHGFEPTPTEARYKALDIGVMFARDRAVDLYAYSSPQEDLAMLFEEAMMKIHFDVQRDVAFTNLPPDGIEEPLCSDHIVAWGVRGRIGAAHVKPRLNLVLGELLPNRNYSGVVDGFEKPIPMRRGRDWCDNLVLGKTVSAPLWQTRSTVSGPRLRPRRRYL